MLAQRVRGKRGDVQRESKIARSGNGSPGMLGRSEKRKKRETQVDDQMRR